jgi:hypothetical protein
MIERLLAIFAFVVLGGFLFILGWKVHRVDLTVVILIAYGLAAIDLWGSMRRGGH